MIHAREMTVNQKSQRGFHEYSNDTNIPDLLRKSFRHREHRENEFFSTASVGSVARQGSLMQEVTSKKFA
jgi:hypothetical protein